MEKKLQVHDLRISFRTVSGKLQAVRGISFDLHKGETLAIVGESGSGKSVTSKAVLGILAGNSIIEGGEILYDGQDLLKISEADFYKLRGDKLSMIFQDPLSSLNPIMRIGKQLTEAMLLKSKARRKTCKKEYTAKCAVLERVMTETNADAAGVKAMWTTFRDINTKAIAQEKAYGEAHEAATEALSEIENALYLIDKNAMKDAKQSFREIRELADRAVAPDMADADVKQLTAELTAGVTAQTRSGNYSAATKTLTALKARLEKAVSAAKPDYFARNDTGNLMISFLKETATALRANTKSYTEKRVKALEALNRALVSVRESLPDDRALSAMVKELGAAVDASIDPLDIVKDSIACTFTTALNDFVRTASEGRRTNDAKERRHQKQLARYNKKVAAGKTPDWKVAAASTIDLDLVRENIESLIRRLIAHYEERRVSDETRDCDAAAKALIAAIRADAVGMVETVTKRLARMRALKLMEEVGIPDARKRYLAYPFQFSGGMRQRIVIAIALAANPDILICDEPTTALDVTIQAQILELINKLKRERNLSIIFITHDLGVVANMADRIAVMYAGKIVEYGTSEEVFYSPAHPYTWALLSSMPDLETKEKLEAIPGTPPNMIYPPKGDAFADRNRYAMKIDYEEEPPIFPITDTHWAATWLLHPDAPKLEPPKVVLDRIEKMKARIQEGRSNG